MYVKLLIGGLLAGAVAIALLVASLASLNTSANIYGLAVGNPNAALRAVLTRQSGADVDAETDMTGTITSTLDMTGTNKVADAITEYFSGTLTTTFTVSDVLGLHNEGWGFGEIFNLFLLAKETGMTPDQIKALRGSGMGWGQIAHSLDVSPGKHGDNLGAAVSGRGITETQTTNTTVNNNGPQSNKDEGHGNPHGGPPGKSESGPPGKSESGPPPGKGKGK